VSEFRAAFLEDTETINVMAPRCSTVIRFFEAENNPKEARMFDIPDDQLNQLMVGVALGAVFFALVCWTPLLRDLLAAIAAVAVTDLLVGANRLGGAGSVVDRLATDVSGYPYFSLGLVLAAVGVATLLRLNGSR
jgi:hypothetical protein